MLSENNPREAIIESDTKPVSYKSHILFNEIIIFAQKVNNENNHTRYLHNYFRTFFYLQRNR